MKIKEIKIQNFRGIDNLCLENADNQMNLIVGVNGAGKTSILESIAILLSWLISRMRSSSARGNSPLESDIKIGSNGVCQLSACLDNGVKWSVMKQRPFTYRSHKKQTTQMTVLGELTAYADEIVGKVEEGGSIPVMMYYPVDRSIASVPVNLHKAEPQIWDVYKDALSGNSNFRSFFEWYRRQEDIENEMIRDDSSYRDHSLEAVRKAMATFFPDFSELRVRRRPRQAMIVKKGEQVVEFTQLSQGEKCYLSLVCDIARRLAIANPNMQNPLDGEGIILVDEIDLHLHPKWQSEIVSKLTSVFKNCQFFLSTHSPLVLSDIRREQIISIKNGEKVDVSFEPYGKEASKIMNSYFDMPFQRNQKIANDINLAFEAIREGDSKKYQRLLTELIPIVGPTDTDIVNLMLEAKRNGLK